MHKAVHSAAPVLRALREGQHLGLEHGAQHDTIEAMEVRAGSSHTFIPLASLSRVLFPWDSWEQGARTDACHGPMSMP